MISSDDADSPEKRLATEERPVDPLFEADEPLYRRVQPSLVQKGIVSPLAFRFDRQSVNRGKFSIPSDVLHKNCCDDRDFSDWKVVKILVKELPHSLTGGTGQTYNFPVRHTPTRSCYPHSEIWCNKTGNADDPYESPSKKIRTEFCAHLAQTASVISQ